LHQSFNASTLLFFLFLELHFMIVAYVSGFRNQITNQLNMDLIIEYKLDWMILYLICIYSSMMFVWLNQWIEPINCSNMNLNI